MQQTAGGLYPDLQRVSSIRLCAKLPATVVAERVIRGTVRLPGAADPVTKDIRKVPGRSEKSPYSRISFPERHSIPVSDG